jgi:hypothetical protein
MTSFGPLVSPSNDVVYTLTAGANISGFLTPTASDYSFAMYLIPSCSPSGTEPVPIGATGTIGTGINVSGVAPGVYYLAVTGSAAGGAGANGHLTFVPDIGPVTLQSFEVE